MKLLDRILHRAPPTAPPPPQASTTCLHVSLVPAWDDPANMGREEHASSFTCAACGQRFSPEEAQTLRESEADRLRQRASDSDSAVAEAERPTSGDEQPPTPSAG
jgi:hypothetical protein